MKFGYRLVTDEQGRIEYKQRDGGKKHFHLEVFVDESSELLDQIRLVEYCLHDSFSRPVRHNDRRSERFREDFYTWGKFTVQVTVLFSDGRREHFQFFLDYSLPPDYGLNYVKIPVT